MDWFNLCRAIDIFVDVVWPTMITSAVLTVATVAAGTYAREALLAPFSL